MSVEEIFVKMLSGHVFSMNKKNINIENIKKELVEYSSEYELLPLWRINLIKERDEYYVFIKDNYVTIKSDVYDTCVRDSKGYKYTKMDIILNSDIEIFRCLLYFDHKEDSFIYSKDIKYWCRQKNKDTDIDIEIISFPKKESRKSLQEILRICVPYEIIPNFAEYHFI